jgi:hypothetical protein
MKLVKRTLKKLLAPVVRELLQEECNKRSQENFDYPRLFSHIYNNILTVSQKVQLSPQQEREKQ